MNHEQAADREIAKWPGVTFTRTKTSNHARLKLFFNGQDGFVIYPCTAGDNYRGVLNHVGDIKFVLRAIGAVRTVEPRAATKRAKGARHDLPSDYEPRPSRLARDPWEPLQAMKADVSDTQKLEQE